LTDETLTIDVGAGNTISPTCAVIDAHNITSGAATIKIQGSDDNFVGTPVDEAISHSTDTMFHFWTASARRYWRFLITDAANPDAYIEIGRVFLGTYLEPARSFGLRFTENLIDTSTNYFSFGGQSYGDEGIVYKTYEINIPYITNAERDNFITFQDTVKKFKPFYFVFDEDDLTSLDPIYCVLDSDIGCNHLITYNWAINFSIREVL